MDRLSQWACLVFGEYIHNYIGEKDGNLSLYAQFYRNDILLLYQFLRIYQ